MTDQDRDQCPKRESDPGVVGDQQDHSGKDRRRQNGHAPQLGSPGRAEDRHRLRAEHQGRHAQHPLRVAPDAWAVQSRVPGCAKRDRQASENLGRPVHIDRFGRAYLGVGLGFFAEEIQLRRCHRLARAEHHAASRVVVDHRRHARRRRFLELARRLLIESERRARKRPDAGLDHLDQSRRNARLRRHLPAGLLEQCAVVAVDHARREHAPPGAWERKLDVVAQRLALTPIRLSIQDRSAFELTTQRLDSRAPRVRRHAVGIGPLLELRVRLRPDRKVSADVVVELLDTLCRGHDRGQSLKRGQDLGDQRLIGRVDARLTQARLLLGARGRIHIQELHRHARQHRPPGGVARGDHRLVARPPDHPCADQRERHDNQRAPPELGRARSAAHQ